jgi:hypothetical protein
MKVPIHKVIPYLVAVLIFTIVSVMYFAPVLEGKKIQQSDITQFIGSSKEIVDFRKENKEEPYWTNATFGGMPSYVVSTYYPNDFIRVLDRALRFLPRPADYLFLYFIGFFSLLLVLKVDWKLGIVGALGFGLSTYLIVILGVGHNAKAHAIAYMPLVLSGILLVFQRKYLIGFIITALAMSLELNASHIQMTYYLMFLVIIFGVVQLLESIKNKEIPHFAKSMGVLVVAVLLALGTNATSLLATQEYASHSTRSKSELTINPDGSPKEQTSGLSRDYITEYSYGISETFNLFIPRFKGGTSREKVENSELQNFLQSAVRNGLDPNDANYLHRISSMYWGDQPIVAAPAYIGAIFIFLFVLALFLVKGKLKKWLVVATVFSILLSWGKNFSMVTDFFINYVPLYNKFRAVSSIQVIAELCVPLLGILGLKELLSAHISKETKLKALKFSTYITGGLALIFVVAGTSLYAFETPIDIQINQQLNGYLDAIVDDRKTLFFDDSVRSLTLVLATAIVIWLFLINKIKRIHLIIGIGVLILIDLVNVDKRYVDDNFFTSARKVDRPYQASAVDKEILKDQSHYRVANFARNMMTDGATSYFHKSLGGYHAAKPGRYQELYDFQIEKRNLEVLNMLNTKYLIVPNEQGQTEMIKNDDANGNAWFVNKIEIVENADEEIRALDSINTKSSALIDRKFVQGDFSTEYIQDSTASIQLTSYKANAISYQYNASAAQFCVFSEMYYSDGWNAYLDGELMPHYRVNYVLRGMQVPKGTHSIEFKFEPQVIKTGNAITLTSYALLLLIPLGWFFTQKRKQNGE